MAKFFGRTSLEELEIDTSIVTDNNSNDTIPHEELIETSELQNDVSEIHTAISEDNASMEEADQQVEELTEIVKENEEKLEENPEEITAADVVASSEALHISARILGMTKSEAEMNGYGVISHESVTLPVSALKLSTESIKEFIVKLIERIKQIFRKVIVAIKKLTAKAVLLFMKYVNLSKYLKNSLSKLNYDSKIKVELDSSDKEEVIRRIGLSIGAINKGNDVTTGLTTFRYDLSINSKIIIKALENNFQSKLTNVNKIADAISTLCNDLASTKLEEFKEEKGKNLKYWVEQVVKIFESNSFVIRGENIKNMLGEDIDNDDLKSKYAVIGAFGSKLVCMKIVKYDKDKQFDIDDSFVPTKHKFKIDTSNIKSFNVESENRTDIENVLAANIKVLNNISNSYKQLDSITTKVENALNKLYKVSDKDASGDEVAEATKAIRYVATIARRVGTDLVADTIWSHISDIMGIHFYCSKFYKVFKEKADEKNNK